MNENITGEGALGRKISVLVFGVTMDEIELAALDEARKFFGESIPLEIVHNYEVFDVRNGPLASQAQGKPYYARVVVRERA